MTRVLWHKQICLVQDIVTKFDPNGTHRQVEVFHKLQEQKLNKKLLMGKYLTGAPAHELKGKERPDNDDNIDSDIDDDDNDEQSFPGIERLEVFLRSTPAFDTLLQDIEAFLSSHRHDIEAEVHKKIESLSPSMKKQMVQDGVPQPKTVFFSGMRRTYERLMGYNTKSPLKAGFRRVKWQCVGLPFIKA